MQIIREICAVRPSLQGRIVDLLRTVPEVSTFCAVFFAFDQLHLLDMYVDVDVHILFSPLQMPSKLVRTAYSVLNPASMSYTVEDVMQKGQLFVHFNCS